MIYCQRATDRRVTAVRNLLMRVGLSLIVVIAGPTTLCSADEAVERKVVDYDAAARLLGGSLQSLILNETVDPHWIGSTGRFWYRRDGAEGPEFVVVAANGAKAPAFDHAGLLPSLARVLGNTSSDKSPLAALKRVKLSDDLTHLTGQVVNRSIDCDVKALQCQAFAAPAPELLLSPDGSRAVLNRSDNLFIREVITGQEHALTNDGAPYFSWGKWPDYWSRTLVNRDAGLKTPPFETYWSPDGRYLLSARVDERKVATYPYVEWVPTDGSRHPIVHEVRLAFFGDRDRGNIEYFLFDLKSGRRQAVKLPDGYESEWLDGPVVGWSRARAQAFLLACTAGRKSCAIFRLDLATGNLNKVIEDSSKTRFEPNTNLYAQPNVRVIEDGAELVWYSDRTGWGQLYLYDGQTGRLKNAITHGDGLVLDIQAVDESRREIYFSAGGREKGRDPYLRQLYRASLDGRSDIRLLTDPAADHEFGSLPPALTLYTGAMPPRAPLNLAAGVFIDTWSTVNQPPISALRSTRDGHVIAELEHADASRLYAAGWRPPLRESIKAADGVTDLYAVYYAPNGVRTAGAVPVIDDEYGGPQVSVAPRSFKEAYAGQNPLSPAALARLGFAVAVIDGRGTPGRSSAFRDAGYPEFTQVGIDDHIAAIHQLANRHAEMDLGRVGVNGWSWGGTFAAQAILSRPQFYKVAVSGAGAYDYPSLYPVFSPWIGLPQYADGTPYRSTPKDSPANWNALEVGRLADRLAGHLLIVCGDQDENAPPHQAFRLVDALTRANKPYDLIYLPNRSHGGGNHDGYTIKRTWDYFVEHLLREDPPFDAVVQEGQKP
jgi:dipeptidyl-peptidase 4